MRYREEDLRADRVESELRVQELEAMQEKAREGKKTRLYQCFECKRLFEERSLHCPFCDRKLMGELKPIPRR